MRKITVALRESFFKSPRDYKNVDCLGTHLIKSKADAI